VEDEGIFNLVWIEPEWNWNTSSGSWSGGSQRVWIEPEWNWNPAPVWQSPPSSSRLNRTRVELKQHPIRCVWADKHVGFESNQSGIETSTCASSGCCHAQVWIEPEWNWNVHIFSTVLLFSSVWIEPEWNWNFISPFMSVERSWFESNQSGIETFFRRCVAELQEGLNRTRVELKPVQWHVLHVANCGFESNQSGIETSRTWGYAGRQLRLNRTRVELKHWLDYNWRTRARRVWIEPEWNWNGELCCSPVRRCICLNRTRVELKRGPHARWRRETRAGLNRTRVELKLDRCSCEWCIIPCLNRTRVELKHGNSTQAFLGRRGLNRTRVELKRPCSDTRRNRYTVWIEPEWNWNARSLNVDAGSAISFESNQSGIETACATLGRRYRTQVWIEPEWNWNRLRVHLHQ